MPVRERELGALPSPVLPPPGRKVWRGHSVFYARISNDEQDQDQDYEHEQNRLPSCS